MKKETFKKTPFLKRQLIVNNSVQWALISYTVFVVLAMISGQWILQTFAVESQSLLVLNNPEITSTIVFLGIFFIFLAILVYGFYLTNRIAGPIHSLKIHMDEINAGNVPKNLSFRKSDFFQEIIEPYNKLLARNHANGAALNSDKDSSASNQSA